MPLRLRFAFFAVSLLLASVSFAQQGRPPRPPDGGMQVRLISILIPSTPNAPFSATVNTESIRQLGDGTTIRLMNHRMIARHGRTHLPGAPHARPGRRQTRFLHHPNCQLENFNAPDFAPPATGAGPEREDLGKKLVNGVETIGTLETKIIESGKIGNDSPIVMKIESWYSPKLGVNLVTRRQDPRTGNQNFELSDITTNEPGVGLFKVPDGYRVIDLRGR